MQMTYEIYKEILSNVRTHLPETGGMLGGRENMVNKIIMDEGVPQQETKCSYVPNVALFNEKIREWKEQGVEFLGIFHTHFWSVSTLSQGDKEYIKNILRVMPPNKKKLYFPIVVFPEKKIVSYYCMYEDDELIIVNDEIEII